MKHLENYVNRAQNTETREMHDTIRDYMYQIIMRPGTTEYAIMVQFKPGLVCELPLGSKNRLGSPTCPIPVSFIYGDRDWVLNIEEDGP